MKNNQGVSNILIIIIVLGGVLVGGYFAYKYLNLISINTSPDSTVDNSGKDSVSTPLQNINTEPNIKPIIKTPEIDFKTEYYEFMSKELGIKMLIPKYSFQYRQNCLKEVKAFQKTGTNELYIYQEEYTNDCKIQKIDTNFFGTEKAERFNFFTLKAYTFKSKAELEKILKENFGKYCKVDSIYTFGNKKMVKMDESFFKSEEYKILSNNQQPYWNFCGYPGKYGSPMYVNFKENKVIFNAGPHEYLHFMYETKEWTKDYDTPMFESIQFLD